MKTQLFSAGDITPVGCSIRDGKLYPEYTAQYLCDAPGNIICAGYSAGANRYLFATDERVYVSANLNSFVDIAAQNAQNPFFLEHISGEETFATIVRSNAAVMHAGTHFTSAILPEGLTCGATHCGRVFGAKEGDATRILWSGEGGIRDWEQKLYGAGYLRLDTARGDILDILEYGEKLAIVRRFGLDILRAYGTPENFALEVGESFGKIIKGTSQVVGGKLYFCTDEGLFRYDGNITKIRGVVASGCSAVYDGRYFVACGQMLFCYDPDGYSFYTDFAPQCMLSANGKLYLFRDGKIYTLFRGGEYLLKVENIRFKSDRKKTLKSVYLDGGASLKVRADGKERTFENAQGSIKVSLRGRIFAVEMRGSGKIGSAELDTEVTYGI